MVIYLPSKINTGKPIKSPGNSTAYSTQAYAAKYILFRRENISVPKTQKVMHIGQISMYIIFMVVTKSQFLMIVFSFLSITYRLGW